MRQNERQLKAPSAEMITQAWASCEDFILKAKKGDRIVIFRGDPDSSLEERLLKNCEFLEKGGSVKIEVVKRKDGPKTVVEKL